MLFSVAAAEAAAWGLAQAPTSETLWYANLRIFGIFQKSHYLLSSSLYFPYSQFFIIALPLFAIATYGLVARRPFLLAVASNLSLVYAAFLLYVGAGSQHHPLAASLSSVAISTGPDIYLPLALVAVSLVSFLVSHFQYILGFIRSMPRASRP